MYDILAGMRIVEAASFIAAPSCALHFQQFGAEVIRCDPIGGGPDYSRWPKATNGRSLYWEGLNKGKKSIAINLRAPEGRELLKNLAAAPGDDSGLFVTNFPENGFLSHKELSALRPDIITVRVMGWPDGTTALDYTVNAATGLPLMTGPEDIGARPVNHVLPAWDIATGLYAAFAMMAAERHRRITGQGAEIRVPLSDIALSFMGHLGQIGEVAATGRDRPRFGNDLFGGFGRDFETRDGERIIVIALTSLQWTGLLKTLGIEEEVAAIEAAIGVDFSVDEGLRFEHRDKLNPVVAAAIARHSLREIEALFEGSKVCWAPYYRLSEVIGKEGFIDETNPVFRNVTHLSGTSYLTPGAAATIPELDRRAPTRAPMLGEHTDEVLARVLGLSGHAIGRLHDEGIVAGADKDGAGM